MNFICVVHHDPGSAYGVSFPDVPDCFAAADDEADIVKNAIAALDDYFADGHEIPDPRGIEEIRAEVADDLAEGAFLMSIPLVERKTQNVRRNVSMERGIWEAIDGAAEQAGLTRSSWLSLAALNEIKGSHVTVMVKRKGPRRSYKRELDLNDVIEAEARATQEEFRGG